MIDTSPSYIQFYRAECITVSGFFSYIYVFSPMTVAKCGAKGLQSSDVPGELENPEDPENPEDLGGLGDVLQGVLGGQEVEENRDEKGQDAH